MGEDIDDMTRPSGELQNTVIRSVVGTSLLIDWLVEDREVMSDKIVAFGISLGGVRTLLSMGVDQRIKAGITYVAGGNLPDLWTECEQVLCKKFREARMEAEGFKTKDDYYNHLVQVNRIDPLLFKDARNWEQDLYMHLSTRDEAMPARNQIELWEEFGYPDAQFYWTKHTYTALRSDFKKRKMKNWFNEKLDLDL